MSPRPPEQPLTAPSPRSSEPEKTAWFAHTAPEVGGEWQPLQDHLEGVAKRAAEAASAFDAEEWGYLAGLWHDLGKYSDAFQSYLRSAASTDVHAADELPRTDHSTAGAQHAVTRFGPLGHVLAFPIAGHHSGLLDAVSDVACLEARLRKRVEPWDAAPSEVTDHDPPDVPLYLAEAFGRRNGFGVAFFVRMLFSALVDADFLDTEAFMDPTHADRRPGWPADVLDRMVESLEHRIAGFGPPRTSVDRRRAEVAAACRAAADRSPGFFSLTVPTGGGKTFSSLLFALRHAQQQGLRRVVYVAPFTSIIEQNADEFRNAMSLPGGQGFPDPVVEHHSSLDTERETVHSRLAAENWDAPLIVTTAVQFYESLFANRTSRCRKLHRLAKSVVILDEAQAIPVDYLEPCVRALEALTGSFGASVVLCTATQPTLHRRDDFPIGLDIPPEREIIPDPPALFAALRRVRVEAVGRLPDEEVADRLVAHEQVLCIVNTRRHARILADLIGQESGHFHLSALMCPEHRTHVLLEVKDRLKAGDRCRVVSTQLIEAGVDVDFPAVYRALAGLDSLAQAAGRCNRNGTTPIGVTTLFDSEHQATETFVKDAQGTTRALLDMYDDLLGLDAVEHYFRLHYWEQSARWDRKGIMSRFQLGKSSLPFLLDFATAARDFRIIDDRGKAVIIPWGATGEALCEELRGAWPYPGRELVRRLQRFTVQIPERLWRTRGAEAFELVHEQYPVLAFPAIHYSEWVGLDLEADAGEQLVR